MLIPKKKKRENNRFKITAYLKHIKKLKLDDFTKSTRNIDFTQHLKWIYTYFLRI